MGVIAILATTYSFAVVDDGVGSIDQECQANGFDFGIVKFEWNTTTNSYTYENPEIPPYDVNVTGDDERADWTASPAVDGVLHKEAGNTFVHAGGTSGTVDMNENAISHITFCGSENGAPEFLTPAIALAVLLTTPAFAYLVVKRR
ncbi:MAG: hypothetical protein A7315_07465 [Candidatus Altiarchaeales archaeon WOR_SM1_79]|nr:MAG: hypothetical protein A7315_07465 [Candidatus Altiarchaeales archaeon WOR_SM1_79]